jgi:RNA polymerase sigma factor (sigma-70 family)
MTNSTPAPWPRALESADDDERTRWGNTVRQYTAQLRGFFVKRVRNPADVDDLVQEVFLQLIQRDRNSKTGEAIEHMEQYTFQAAANVLRDRGRRDQVRHRSAHESFDEALHALTTEITPERIVLGHEGIDRVNAVLSQLPERTRDVFVLRWTEKQSFPEIAQMLGMSTRAAQRHMALALKHLGGVLG